MENLNIAFSILIESQWNLNLYSSNGLLAAQVILIESQWNLNLIWTSENPCGQ